MIKMIAALACSAALLTACNNANDAAEDAMEQSAEASAVAAGSAEAALGLTEIQLLDAEIIGDGGLELGDVASVVRDENGNVDRLLVEIEDSVPDRFVHVAISDLKPVQRGDDTDLSTRMTAEQLAALPDVPINQQNP
ncbi:PRC-barrel domain containing protein [Pacificimonas sp. ICDLI1SI03]